MGQRSETGDRKCTHTENKPDLLDRPGQGSFLLLGFLASLWHAMKGNSLLLLSEWNSCSQLRVGQFSLFQHQHTHTQLSFETGISIQYHKILKNNFKLGTIFPELQSKHLERWWFSSSSTTTIVTKIFELSVIARK